MSIEPHGQPVSGLAAASITYINLPWDLDTYRKLRAGHSSTGICNFADQNRLFTFESPLSASTYLAILEICMNIERFTKCFSKTTGISTKYFRETILYSKYLGKFEHFPERQICRLSNSETCVQVDWKFT